MCGISDFFLLNIFNISKFFSIFSISSVCTFNIISGAAVDYGGNSIGVGLVTWGFFSPAATSPPTMRQQTGRQHPVLRNILKLLQHPEIFSNYCNHNHDVGESANPWSHSYLAMDTICPILAPLREEGEEWDTTGRGAVGSSSVGFVVCSAAEYLLAR